MRAAAVLLAGLCLGCPLRAGQPPKREAPNYTAASIVNSASNLPGELSPNAIATIYGKELAYITRAIRAEDIHNGVLPVTLPGTGVRVLVKRLTPAHIYYVSPGQVNFLVPANLLPGPVEIQLVVDGRAGPEITVNLGSASPALFQLDATTALSTHADGSLVTRDTPARPGEDVVVYVNGLGQTDPSLVYGEVARAAATIRQLAELRVSLDGVVLDRGAIAYAGVTPGSAGLYQINLRLPRETPADPELRIAIGEAASPPGVRLPVRPD